MARELILSLNKKRSTFAISKVDRKKLYGYKKRTYLDEKGIECSRANLEEETGIVFESGDYNSCYVDNNGNEVWNTSGTSSSPNGSTYAGDEPFSEAENRAVRHLVESKSFMNQENSELHRSNWRQGKVLKESGIQIFQIETTVNNNTFGYDGPLAMLQKREWEWTFKDRISFLGMQAGLKRMSPASKRKSFQGWYSPYEITSVQAGEVEAVHKVTTENVYKQHLVQVEGQTDILTMGLPYICPYNVNSVMNPILVACLGLGYFFNMYKGKPLVRNGGVVIMTHPTPWEFHPVHHPSYIDFFERVLSETTDPSVMSQKFEKSFAEDDWYRHLYRTSYAYHGVHPFYMWYWCAHALDHLSEVIIVGGNQEAVRRMGFRSATTLQDAFEIASDSVGFSPTITHYHSPPILMADVT